MKSNTCRKPIRHQKHTSFHNRSGRTSLEKILIAGACLLFAVSVIFGVLYFTGRSPAFKDQPAAIGSSNTSAADVTEPSETTVSTQTGSTAPATDVSSDISAAQSTTASSPSVLGATKPAAKTTAAQTTIPASTTAEIPLLTPGETTAAPLFTIPSFTVPSFTDTSYTVPSITDTTMTIPTSLTIPASIPSFSIPSYNSN